MVRVSESGNERRGLTCGETQTQRYYINRQLEKIYHRRKLKYTDKNISLNKIARCCYFG